MRFFVLIESINPITIESQVDSRVKDYQQEQQQAAENRKEEKRSFRSGLLM